MEYLSSYTIYNEVIDGMKAMGISRDELAANLQMKHHQKSGKCENSTNNWPDYVKIAPQNSTDYVKSAY